MWLGLLYLADTNQNAIVFDTTAVNTSRINGNYSIMENLLQKPLVWLACVNYSYEIILRSVLM